MAPQVRHSRNSARSMRKVLNNGVAISRRLRPDRQRQSRFEIPLWAVREKAASVESTGGPINYSEAGSNPRSGEKYEKDMSVFGEAEARDSGAAGCTPADWFEGPIRGVGMTYSS
jgi:hypothetical protein